MAPELTRRTEKPVTNRPTDVDTYLAGLPPATRRAVARVRATVHDAVPGLGESISYGIPTFTRNGRPVLHVAGWRDHVAVYPRPRGDPALTADLAPYASGKGTVKFALSEEIPLALVARVAKALDSPA
jgi:uncharacterized protein YdhG (YjbR/CyaY superfamily)